MLVSTEPTKRTFVLNQPSLKKTKKTLPTATGLARPPGEAAADASQPQPVSERLTRLEAQLGRVTRLWPGMLFTQHPDFSMHDVHGRHEELTGAALGALSANPRQFWEILHEAEHEEFKRHCRQSAKAAEALTATWRIRHTVTGRVSYVLEHRQARLGPAGELLGYEVAWQDVTRQTIAEKRLANAAWKETLALLTMGLAHDFNNIMAGILSFAELLIAKSQPESPEARPLKLIKQGTLQASELIHRIVNLHRCKTGAREYVDLNQMVPDVVQLVCKVLPRQIKVETALGQAPLPVFMDSVGFRQVALNLALNAADAMPQGGVLTFHLSAHTEPCALVHAHGKFPRVPCVCLSLLDTGSGIAPRHLPHIFDPFFTTKPLAKGSGLGLYNARLFVEEHAGAISVESTEGAGTTFRLWLPQADFTEAESRAAQNAQRRRSLLLVGQPGSATESVVEFLRTNNFAVVATHSPARAVELLAAGDMPAEGVLVVCEPGDKAMLELVPELRTRRLTERVGLHLLGGSPDQVDKRYLDKAKLVLAGENADVTVLLKKIETLCTDSPS
jgi:signal transduction histidine kinase